MQRDGLVARTVYAVVPPPVEYNFTPLGITLLRPLTAICQWAEEYLPEVVRARARPGARMPAGQVTGAGTA